MDNVLDLKNHPELLPQYVDLRNRYCELLLTQPVEIAETIQWMHETTTEIWAIAEDNCIHGVLLLYISRGGEIAFFATQKNRGTGTKLLHLADQIAQKKKLASIWAWVRKDNPIAANVFKKCGYSESGDEDRTFRDQRIKGTRFIKNIMEKMI
ncbi:GNAT family N-acetyltransferase [Trichlorobacter lovleyi]|uniref:GNAT family N-acetyltransferase n=1 Tax=Trichlorobacter lovleyi TaxID=313985 RepID=UPI002240CB91|nr:GNAT family N-acetyltransferase [Trichlorobacter lovleyi]QOX80358.1 GNAT family N-acetyltransferase [Trichlorobacter lovleyi]